MRNDALWDSRGIYHDKVTLTKRFRALFSKDHAQDDKTSHFPLISHQITVISDEDSDSSLESAATEKDRHGFITAIRF